MTLHTFRIQFISLKEMVEESYVLSYYVNAGDRAQIHLDLAKGKSRLDGFPPPISATSCLRMRYLPEVYE